MKNRSLLWMAFVGAVAGILMSIDTLVLSGRPTIEAQYMNAVFPFNEFIYYRQYFVSFKIVLASLVFLCFSVNVMKQHQYPYVLLRVKNKYKWELSLTLEIIKQSVLFFFGFTLSIFLISCYSSEGKLTLNAWLTWLLSWIALVYLGVLLGCMVNLLAGVAKEKTAVIVTYVFFLLGTYATMRYSDFFASTKALLYLNPVTAISVAEERHVLAVFLTMIGMCGICFACQSLLAYGYTRWEKCIRSED